MRAAVIAGAAIVAVVLVIEAAWIDGAAGEAAPRAIDHAEARVSIDRAPPGPARAIDPRAPSPADELPPLPRSLDGTEPDGAFTTDDDGRFVATRAARRAFDYYLVAEGEEPDDVIRARVAARARATLAPGEADRAVALFDRYRDYRARGAALLAARPDDPLAAVVGLQRAIFGADDADRLFAADDAALAEALAATRAARAADR